MARILIVGCGYTGRVVAESLAAQGHQIIATSRNPERLVDLPVEAVQLDIASESDVELLRAICSPETRVLVSIPEVNQRTAEAVSDAARVVFLSTTGVYGAQLEVDVTSVPAPRSDRERARLQSEDLIRASVRHSMVLRPAAIYGQGRGIHMGMRAGTYQLAGDGSNLVSRIHVDDLAAHVVAALFSDIEGAWPVADEEPCTSREIAEFCAHLLGLPMPSSVPSASLGETRRANRRVDGSAIRGMLGLQLKYPSYRSGIPACVFKEAEARAR